MRLSLLIIVFSLVLALAPALASEENCPPNYAGTAARPKMPELTPREKLVAAVVRGNMEMPQQDQGIRQTVLNALLKDPELLPMAFQRAHTVELEAIGEKMNKVHAAYGVKHRTVGHAEAIPGMEVTLERLAALQDGFEIRGVRDYLKLASRVEPEKSFWRGLGDMDERQMRASKDRIIRELREFRERQDAKGPTCPFSRFRASLEAQQKSPELKEYTKKYREHVRKLNEKGPLSLSDQSYLRRVVPPNLEAFLKKYLPEGLSEEEKKSVMELYPWKHHPNDDL